VGPFFRARVARLAGVVTSPPPSREDALRAELARILETTEYRAGALVMTAPPEPGKGDVRIVSVVLLKPTSDAAPDLTWLPRRLRQVADELEAVVRGDAPLPPQGEPHPPHGAKWPPPKGAACCTYREPGSAR
jgi:hypothetical protein